MNARVNAITGQITFRGCSSSSLREESEWHDMTRRQVYALQRHGLLEQANAVRGLSS